MNGLIEWWARNSVAANLLMIAIFIGGIVTFIRMDREVFPAGKDRDVQVTVAWQGASPIEVEEQIILRVEEAVTGIDNLRDIRSTASEGFASVVISMEDRANFTEFLNEVKSRVDGISTLPRGAFPPIVQRQPERNQNFAISIAGNIPERELYRLANKFKDELAALPNGSPLVRVQGVRQEEVSIEVSEQALQRYGLTFDDISRAVSGSSINGSSGNVRTETGRINLAVRNLADTQEEFERIIIRQNPDGSFIRVSDVATVIDGFVDSEFISQRNGKRSISINIDAPESGNVVALSKSVNAWLNDKIDNNKLPEGVELKIEFDFSEAYVERMELVSSNAFTGLVMVMIVLILFLRPVVAFWVVVGIATSFAGAFIFLPVSGVTLNMLSLFGLLLVIGIVVDDALIVGESIHRQTERGKTGLEAALAGTTIVAKPVFFAVITTMIAFMPWVLIGGEVSQFTLHITFTVIFALTFSLIESFFILPAHLAHMKPVNEKNAFAQVQQSIADSMIWFANSFYRPLISLAIKARYLTVSTFVMILILSITLPMAGWIKLGFMPEVEAPFININITPREGTPYSRNLEIYDNVVKATSKIQEQTRAQQGDNQVVESIFIYASEANVGAFMNLNDGDWRTLTAAEIGEMLRDEIGDIPDAEAIDISTTLSGGGADLNFGIESDNIEQLRLAAEDIKGYLRSVTGVYEVRDQLQSASDEIQVKLKPGAERFNLSLAEVSRQVRQAYFGEEVQRLPRDGEDVRVMVRYPKETRESLESLQSFRIRTADGREIPLAAVVDVEFVPSFNQIRRFNRKRSTNISASVREGIDVTPIRQGFYRDFMPEFKQRYPDVNLAARGQDRAQAEFVGDLMMWILVAIFLMYMVLAIGFSSYFQPILIMSAIPFALMGAIFGHLFWGEGLVLFSIFGICAASGVVVNDNLVLVDYVNRLRREGAGAFAALVEAGTTRFRPIVLTSITTFIGLVPIIMEDSINANFLRPMVLALAFGVMFALFVTLIFVPALYAVGVDISRFYRGLWTGEPQPSLGEGDSLTNELPDVDQLLKEEEEMENRPSLAE